MHKSLLVSLQVIRVLFREAKAC